LNTSDSKGPLIIVIGGAAGVGKTSVAKALCAELDITHRLGSGFIREIAKAFISPQENAFLYNYSFRPHIYIAPFENLWKQSEVIKDSMNLCINRAFSEGTSLLIEGVNIIPGLLDTKYVSLGIILTIDNYDRHFEMIAGKTHSKRNISRDDFEKVREVQDEFKKAAHINGWPVIEAGSTDNVVKTVRNLLKDREKR
jgi:2-phosphoglycerate kinase